MASSVCLSIVAAIRYILKQVSEQVNRKCPLRTQFFNFQPLHRPRPFKLLTTKISNAAQRTMHTLHGVHYGSRADKRLFGHISSKTHCLHYLLPPQRSVRTASSLTTRGHNFTLPHTDFNPYKNSFINRCLFQFL